MVIYAKPVKHQKTGALRLIVYKQAHRSFIDAHDHADVKGKAETGQNIFELQIYNADEVQTLHLRAPSKSVDKNRFVETLLHGGSFRRTEKTRWLEAFHPAMDEEAYAAWNVPRARVTVNYDAREPDELTLRVGDELRLLTKGHDGMCKGQFADGRGGQNTGWFPTSKFFFSYRSSCEFLRTH
jgi:hypothetical protein